MYIVTGAAGFIGSNVIAAMNQAGITDIVAVDNLTQGDKFKNLVDLDIMDYYDKVDFRQRLANKEFDGKIKAIIHQGACSSTTESNGLYMMDNNYRYSMELLQYCQHHAIAFLYASSAAVYGKTETFIEDPANEGPLNVYGYSKLLFDQQVRKRLPARSAQIVGFRYFNVYGFREWHKGSMSSVAYHFFNQYMKDGQVRLFSATDGLKNGEQLRDFVSVEDIASANLWFLQDGKASGIFNLGTGQAQSFNQVAVATVNGIRRLKGEPVMSLESMQAEKIIDYIPFPEHLRGKYQNFTQADLSHLRSSGYSHDFLSVEEGVFRYIETLYRQVSS